MDELIWQPAFRKNTISEKGVQHYHVEEDYPLRRPSTFFDYSAEAERAPEARGRNLVDVPKSYWVNPVFLNSYCTIGFGFMAATGGYALIAPLLGLINNELGPSHNITWVALANLHCQAVTFLVIGRLSDIFGRRWFFIIGSIIGLIGSILGATAQSVNQHIGAQVFIGVATGFRISFLLGRQ